MENSKIELPPITDKRWKDIVLGTDYIQPNLLVLKFMLSRINLRNKMDPSKENIQKSIDEVHNFFLKNMNTAADDAVRLLRLQQGK